MPAISSLDCRSGLFTHMNRVTPVISKSRPRAHSTAMCCSFCICSQIHNRQVQLRRRSILILWMISQNPSIITGAPHRLTNRENHTRLVDIQRTWQDPQDVVAVLGNESRDLNPWQKEETTEPLATIAIPHLSVFFRNKPLSLRSRGTCHR
jgi:hypothetical protein